MHENILDNGKKMLKETHMIEHHPLSHYDGFGVKQDQIRQWLPVSFRFVNRDTGWIFDAADMDAIWDAFGNACFFEEATTFLLIEDSYTSPICAMLQANGKFVIRLIPGRGALIDTCGFWHDVTRIREGDLPSVQVCVAGCDAVQMRPPKGIIYDYVTTLMYKKLDKAGVVGSQTVNIACLADECLYHVPRFHDCRENTSLFIADYVCTPRLGLRLLDSRHHEHKALIAASRRGPVEEPPLPIPPEGVSLADFLEGRARTEVVDPDSIPMDPEMQGMHNLMMDLMPHSRSGYSSAGGSLLEREGEREIQ